VDAKKQGLIEIVGNDNVLDSPDILAGYSRDQSFVLPMKPRFVIRPQNADQVQKIVKWANQTQTGLIPVSSGPPHFYGDTVPSAPGAVIVDLTGLNRIIHVDRRNRMTLVEPGVTYSQLQPELAKDGLRICSPFLPRSNKSVVASLLERQPTLIPRFEWSVIDPLRCIEVIFGDGNKLKTGDAGSHASSLEDEWRLGFAQQSPSGPGQIDYYRLVTGAQGSMGIVTWASLKCQVLPQVHKLYFVPAQKLESLIDFAYKLLRFRFGDELILLNSVNLASMLTDSPDKIRELCEKLPSWVQIVGVSGGSVLPEERVISQEHDIRDIAQQYGLQLLSAVPGVSDGDALEALLNTSKEPYWKLSPRGGCQDIFFITTLDKTPQFLSIMYSLTEEFNFSTSELGVYIQPVHQGTSCHCEFNLRFDPRSENEVSRIKTLFNQASEELINQGAFFSRPYGTWANMAFNRDARATITLKKLKGIFDPNNVMNPGKLCF
jgi:hypothetical protein